MPVSTHHPPAWEAPWLPEPLARQAKHTARQIASRLSSPDSLPHLAARAAAQSGYPVWDGTTLSHGHAGLALLHLYAARTGGGETDRERAFSFLRAAFEHTHAEPLVAPGIFGGTSGLAMVLADCRTDEPRFESSLQNLHDRMAEQVLAIGWPDSGIADNDYDVISGAAGILGYLCTEPGQNGRLCAATDQVLDFLLGLIADSPTLDRLVIAPEQYPREDYRKDYPHGYVNVGFAHGIPGIAAALAAAWRSGRRSSRLRTALDATINWLLSVQLADEHGPLWPRGVPLTSDGTQTVRSDHLHDQLAWCYGTAGVSAALLEVAHAIGDETLRTTSVQAFESVLRRGPSRRTVLSPTLCHGMAGLVTICTVFAALGRSEQAAAALPSLVEELLAYADSGLPLLFADQDEPGNFVDDPGLLTGAAGVGLTLFAVTAEHRPSWHTAFFLS
ncbi:lanthionine synthetase C family protein [Streptomyces syringium]|uniref:lanthionine synthetase C family protein n=1 Tax=Streptomyces syringium TaxID=76729 RepID=UPI0033F52D72